jgi:hypothetical protein
VQPAPNKRWLSGEARKKDRENKKISSGVYAYEEAFGIKKNFPNLEIFGTNL